jgi:hypothetical protein
VENFDRRVGNYSIFSDISVILREKNIPRVPAMYDNGERSDRRLAICLSSEHSTLPPEAEMLLRIGTQGVMFAMKTSFIFSRSSHL